MDARSEVEEQRNFDVSNEEEEQHGKNFGLELRGRKWNLQGAFIASRVTTTQHKDTL